MVPNVGNAALERKESEADKHGTEEGRERECYRKPESPLLPVLVVVRPTSGEHCTPPHPSHGDLSAAAAREK